MGERERLLPLLGFLGFLALLVVMGAGATPAAAHHTPRPDCGGEPATIYEGHGFNSATDRVNGVVRITGTSGKDVIVATTGADLISALGGNDIICAREGNDDIAAGSGNDTVFAGAGDDIIRAGDGNDHIRGGAGNDDLNGFLGSDELFGGDGNDDLSGHNGVDTFNGGPGTDVCNDSTPFTELPRNCESGRLAAPTPPPPPPTTPPPPIDDFRPRCFDEPVTIERSGTQAATGGPGRDVILHTGTGPVSGGGGDDLICGGGTIDGGDGDDTVQAFSNTETVHGGDGDDTIIGSRQDERIWGGNGNDRVSGRGGGDDINGDSGNDVLWVLDVTQDGQTGEGSDLDGGPGNDTLVGGPDDDRLFGNSGDDRIDGHGGDDDLFGGLGADTLRGGDGNDQLLDAAWNAFDKDLDWLIGGDGNDRLIEASTVFGGKPMVLRPGRGCDTLDYDFFSGEVDGRLRQTNDYFEVHDSCDTVEGELNRGGSELNLPDGVELEIPIPSRVRLDQSYAPSNITISTPWRSDVEQIVCSNELPYFEDVSTCRVLFGEEEGDGGNVPDTFYDVDFQVPKVDAAQTVDAGNGVVHLRHRSGVGFEGCVAANPLDYICDYVAFEIQPLDVALLSPPDDWDPGSNREALEDGFVCALSIASVWFDVRTARQGGVPVPDNGLVPDLVRACAEPVGDILDRGLGAGPQPVPGNGGLSGELVITGVQTSQSGFALLSNGTRQWIESGCYSQVRAAGVSVRQVNYGATVQPLTNVNGTYSCSELIGLLSTGGGLSGELVFTGVQSPQSGFVLLSDGTRQWVDASCYAQLRAAGISTRQVGYGATVQPLRNVNGTYSCNDLQALL